MTSASASGSASTKSAPERRKAQYYHPCVWGDFFLTHVFDTNDETICRWKEETEVLKSEVKRMLLADDEENKSFDHLNSIDVIQRLGIGYHFEPEIKRIVQQQVDRDRDRESITDDDADLHTVALRFRILRQHGHNAPNDEFEKFKDEHGEFKKELTDDIEGLLSLYEASFMRTHGETILDEAMVFTETHLKSVEFDDAADSALAERVAHALKRPLRKEIEKLQHLFFIRNYEKIQGHNQSLLKLAKLSFNLLQHMYQHELKVLTKWWIELDFSSKVFYARHKLVETYYWSLGLLWEPKYSLARYIVTKQTTIGTVLDDTYDNYGTFEELELFTSKCARWDTYTDDLDMSMKYVYEAVMDLNEEIGVITSKEGRPYCLEYAKRALTINLTAYLDEQRWHVNGIVPSLEEYRHLFSINTFCLAVFTTAICGMGELLAPKQVFDWLFADPKILFATTDQCRLLDDIATNEREQERGHGPSSVQIYMKQFGVTKEEAIDALYGYIDDDWRTINEEMMMLMNRPTVIPNEFLAVFLGNAQIMETLYRDTVDSYTFSDTLTKDILTALLVTPMPI
ncbi:Probable terpene synthase 3 [Linum perenne]